MTGADPAPGAIGNGGDRRVGVIDIGSNSVRLVVYESGKRVPVVVFNEKVLCGLGRGLPTTGRLHPEGVEMALNATRRFTALAHEMGVDALETVATAAVREAADGKGFVRTVSNQCGHQLRVLTGEEEGRYSACGVLAGIPGAHGLVGDLGGGSLELVAIEQGVIGRAATLPLGALQLLDLAGDDPAAALPAIEKALQDQVWLEGPPGGIFYAVGGAWRALAKLHMTETGYPLRILHHYVVAGDEMRRFAEFIAGQDRDALKRFPRAPKKRLATLPYAALALAGVLAIIEPRKVVFSAFGLREGLLFASLPDEIRQLDPLVEECRARGREQGRFPEHGDELFEWISPLFHAETAALRGLRQAACLLSDLGWRGHPDYRAELVLYQVLNGQFFSLDHPGRALIALALFVCYSGRAASNGAERARELLTDEEIVVAVRIGAALRLGQRISGGTGGLLKKCRLVVENGELALVVSKRSAHLVGEVAERRLSQLGECIGVKTRVEITD